MKPTDPEALPTLPEIYALRPWYHDFSRLGLKTDFSDLPVGFGERLRKIAGAIGSRLAPGGRIEKGERLLSRAAINPRPRTHVVNQRRKEEILLPYLARALDDLPERPACLELFCADGYYSCHLARSRPGAAVTGVDLDPAEIQRARTAARVLSCPGATFEVSDVHLFLEGAQRTYDLVLCAGGLYHLADPRRLLAVLAPVARRFLVVQSVVSLETEDPDYFVAPAPGWRHGSRFSHAGLERWLVELGWRILASDRNELPANRRRRDRGSSYFLCVHESQRAGGGGPLPPRVLPLPASFTGDCGVAG